jgi:hypothetical protein
LSVQIGEDHLADDPRRLPEMGVVGVAVGVVGELARREVHEQLRRRRLANSLK